MSDRGAAARPGTKLWHAGQGSGKGRPRAPGRQG